VPTEDRLWPDQERSPAFSRHQTGEEGDESPIGPGEAGTGDLPLQHGQLVTEHEDLRILGHRVHSMDTDELDDAPDELKQEGEGHEG